MSVTPVCRVATPDDLPALVALEALFPGDRLSRRSLAAALQRRTSHVWVVEAAPGEVLANLVCFTRRDSPWWRIYSVVVHPSGRGKGHARRLMAAVSDAALRAGAAGLRLEVREDNAAARGLYAALGFTVRGRRPGYYDDGAAAVQLQRPFVAHGRLA